MKTKKKINPALATPQASRALRTGSRTRAADAPEDDDKKKPGGDDADAAEEDEAPETEGASAPDLAGCAETCTAAAEALRASAEAFEAQAESLGKGVDSITEIGATREAWMAADEAGDVADKALAALSGAAPAPDLDDAAPMAPPPAPDAQAIARVAGGSAQAQAEVTAQLAAMRRMMSAGGAKSLAALELQHTAGLTALARLGEVERGEKKRAADAAAKAMAAAETAKVSRLAAAVHAGMPKAQAFNVGADGKDTPKAAWMAVDLKTLDAQLVELGYPADAPPARSTLIHALPVDDETGIAARAAAAGLSVEEYKAARKRVDNSLKESTR